MEIKLVNVAKASLHELLIDYEDYLRTLKHRQWERHSVEMKVMHKLGREHNETAFFLKMIETRPPGKHRNMAIVLIKQTDYLLFRQLKALGTAFLEGDNMREKMTTARLATRKKAPLKTLKTLKQPIPFPPSVGGKGIVYGISIIRP